MKTTLKKNQSTGLAQNQLPNVPSAPKLFLPSLSMRIIPILSYRIEIL